MIREEIIDGLEIYTVGRSNKATVHITVEELQKFIDAIKSLEQEPCDDMVSRETVEDIRKALHVWANNFMSTKTIDNIFNMCLEEAEQEVEPEPNIGHWREVDTNQYACCYCNHCFSIDIEDNSIKEYMHCPNCGKNMFELQERIDERI